MRDGTTPLAPAAARQEYVRWRTYLEQDAQGWFCVAGFWYGRFGPVGEPGTEPAREPDDTLRVGPFPSRQVARFELRHGFRDCITRAQQAFLARCEGAQIVGAAFGDVPDDEHEEH